MAINNAVYRPHVGAIALAYYGGGAGSAGMESASGSLADVGGIRIIDKRLFRVGGVSFVDSVGNLGLEDVRLG